MLKLVVTALLLAAATADTMDENWLFMNTAVKVLFDKLKLEKSGSLLGYNHFTLRVNTTICITK